MSDPTWTPQPPEEALRFFRRKGYLTGFDWRDVPPEAHAHAFTVAKLMDAQLLADVRSYVDRAIAEGWTVERFKAELTPELQRRGWWGRQAQPDPATGERRTVQLGSPRRLETIFDTNARTAYAAGRWEQIQRTKARRPYLRYVAILDSRTRPQHRAWHGLVLPADDPFWQTHFPPNGWRCRCTVQQLNDRDLTRYGYPLGSAPPVVTHRWDNPRTGDVRYVPHGIDPGFDVNVGLARTAPSERAARAFAEALAAQPADLGAATWAVASDQVVPALTRGFATWADQVLAVPAGTYGRIAESQAVWPVGALSPASLAALRALGVATPASALVVVRGKELRHLGRAAKRERAQDVDPAVIRVLPAALARRRALLWDTVDPALVAVLDGADSGVAPGDTAKVVVRLALRIAGTFGEAGASEKRTVNSVRIAGVVWRYNLAERRADDPSRPRYEVVEGAL